MAVGYLGESSTALSDRVRRTVALLRRRGYAVAPSRLAELCLGGPVTEADVRWAVAANPGLAIAEDLVVEQEAINRAVDICSRALTHGAAARRPAAHDREPHSRALAMPSPTKAGRGHGVRAARR